MPTTVAILHVTVMGRGCYSSQFHVENTRDKLENTFFIERRTDRKMIVLCMPGSKNEALELRLDRGQENAVPPSRDQT